MNDAADRREQPTETLMLEVRKTFQNVFKGVVVCIVFLVVLTGAAILFIAMKGGMHLSEKLLIVRFIQVSFGMTIGSSCVFFGVILIWLGITASASVSATGKAPEVKGHLKMASASPGVIVALAGIILITLSLYRPVGFEENLIPEPIMMPEAI